MNNKYNCWKTYISERFQSSILKSSNFKIVLLLLFATTSWAQNKPKPEVIPGADQPVVYSYQHYVNLEPYWDKEKVCHNPHKGWYTHHFDNSVSFYGNRLKPNDYLTDFPALDHIYLRLAWAYLEPQEGKFNWAIIDKEIDRWTKKGYKIAFRVSAKETGGFEGHGFATPKWVMQAGAKGTMIDKGGKKDWEPDYGDPVFLQKLENFHRAFAARYDDKPWVSYVDLGSLGDWGEFHTAASSRKEYSAEVIKKHIDIHTKYYKKSLLVISDDVIGSREIQDGSSEEILQYLLANGITFRDDSISVEWYVSRFGFSTVRNPELFEMVWDKYPTVLELEHYGNTIKSASWKDGKPMEKALEEMHATYIGFHWYPREWFAANPDLAKKLANKCGYWYFPKYTWANDTLKAGKTGNYLKMIWENHGVAPAYHQYDLSLKLENYNNNQSYTQKLSESNNLNWKPGRLVAEKYNLNIPANLPAGKYLLKIRMQGNDAFGIRNIDLGLSNKIKDKEGYFLLGMIDVK